MNWFLFLKLKMCDTDRPYKWTPPPLPSKVIWDFGILGFRGSLSYEGVYFVGGGHFILHPFSHFEMQDFKNSKSF